MDFLTFYKMIASFFSLDATNAFERVYDHITAFGKKSKKGTLYAKDVIIQIDHPERRIITTPWRKFNPGYAEREWQWYLSGDRSVAEIKKYASIWDKMHGGDNIVNSNYGWQWMRNNQLGKVIDQLRQDPHTRQAWFSIFDGKEKEQYTYDAPCTLAVGFDIVDGFLNMTVLMRSNDLVYGFCNDQYCWTKLQERVADELGIKIGSYTHYARDMHIYEKHWHMKNDYYGLKRKEY